MWSTHGRQIVTSRRRALLVGIAGLVHCTCTSATVRSQGRRDPARAKLGSTPQTPPAVILGRGGDGLPPAVADMRSAILAAVETGDIAELKGVMDLNELKPEFGGPAETDPIAYLRSVAADGTGRDILALLAKLLEGGWAAIPGGRDIENNRIYVWPQFAERPLGELSAAEQAELADHVGAAKADTMIASGRWQGWRLSIGADGVWHTFMHIGQRDGDPPKAQP